jgi:Fungal specific transcription factor domain
MTAAWVWFIMSGQCLERVTFASLTLQLFSALILQYISHANIQIAHVQCLVLMSSFLCSVNCLPQAWILIGQAVRTGQDLGLHVSPLIRDFPIRDADAWFV